MDISQLRKECPNVAKFIRMCKDVMTASIFENVLLGELSMDWNNGNPQFSLTEKGIKKVESMVKKQ